MICLSMRPWHAIDLMFTFKGWGNSNCMKCSNFHVHFRINVFILYFISLITKQIN